MCTVLVNLWGLGCLKVSQSKPTSQAEALMVRDVDECSNEGQHVENHRKFLPPKPETYDAAVDRTRDEPPMEPVPMSKKERRLVARRSCNNLT